MLQVLNYRVETYDLYHSISCYHYPHILSERKKICLTPRMFEESQGRPGIRITAGHTCRHVSTNSERSLQYMYKSWQSPMETIALTAGTNAIRLYHDYIHHFSTCSLPICFIPVSCSIANLNPKRNTGRILIL